MRLPLCWWSQRQTGRAQRQGAPDGRNRARRLRTPARHDAPSRRPAPLMVAVGRGARAVWLVAAVPLMLPGLLTGPGGRAGSARSARHAERHKKIAN
ncbi:hypothetical protein [Streptomyces sp. DSM 15324]|uniref:hypothetical protein n=1 Tax=Streptomyces sp. DSM 15324 TaxID=1739111 RepID=UPI00131D863D|nr:hypothetical protein [Streptomyces sp. DSM 15324]